MSNQNTVEIRPLDDPDQLHQTVQLYRRVFGLSPTDPAIGPRLLAALRHNGGSVIGAFRDQTLVGFVYGFIGMDPDTREVYHYSQTAAVAPELQGAGIGRALKLGQRDVVLATGITRMRWSFDPLRAANAHFNLDVLGARGRWLVPNLYGIERMGPDLGLPSDRMIVDWNLAAARPAPAPGGDAEATGDAEASRAGSTGDVGTPQAAEPDPVHGRLPEPGETIEVSDRLLIGVPPRPVHDPDIRNAVSGALADALATGRVAVSCVRRSDAAYYVLTTEKTEPGQQVRTGTKEES